MAASGAPVRQLRRGPAPIASFDHDGSDESSPETKQTFRLPEIREDPASTASTALAPPEQRARSHSTPAVPALLASGSSGLSTPAAPRIDISRASSSSHHDSRDSSPELALFAGTGGDDSRGRLELGFREDGALELRSSTEELAFLEGAPGEPRATAPPAAASRRHSRKDSQSSEAALLAVSGRTSRLSSVGSQCSAHSALSAYSHHSRVSVGRLSVVSGISRSPSPHRMLLETSFCGPKPIETDPEICAAAVEERLLEIAKMSATSPGGTAPQPLDARDRREVRTEATVERAVTRAPPPSPLPLAAPTLTSTPTVTPTPITPALIPPVPTPAPTPAPDDDKFQKETQNRARAQERRARPRVRREPSEPEVYKSANRSKDIIRIKLKPDDDYEEEKDESTHTVVAEVGAEMARKPDTLELVRAARPSEQVGRASSPAGRNTEGRVDPSTASPSTGSRRLPRDSRTPSPAGVVVSRKSSFCSLFKSRETIASPDSPSDALRRKRSLTEGRSRSKSRDRSATPTSTGKIRGSVLSLFRTPRKSAASPTPSSREGSPVVQPQRQIASVPSQSVDRSRQGDKLKYYEDTKDGIIHIPLRTPPDERPGSSGTRRVPEAIKGTAEVTTHREPTRPASAPHPRSTSPSVTQKPMHRTVLPDGSIIIPLRSPTERPSDDPSPPVGTIPATTEHPIQVEPQSSTTAAASGDAHTTPHDSFECAATPLPNSEPVEAALTSDEGRRRRKERLVFTTHVGSREQVFSTQFSITKTPSVTSEISGSFPSFVDGDETRPEVRPTTTRELAAAPGGTLASSPGVPSPASPAEAVRDSSESEPSSESAPPIAGDDVEKRGLVVQQSFEEELPYVPTTLPQERSVALPMVPVRERGGVLVSGVSRPRAALSAPPTPRPAPLAAPPAPPPPSDKLRIRLPRRPSAAAEPRRADRPRTRSGSDCLESHHPKAEWIDFSEVPERRKQPKRIQTLPATSGGAGVVFSYVEPEYCRCECHNSDSLSTAPQHSAETVVYESHQSKGAPQGEASVYEQPRSTEQCFSASSPQSNTDTGHVQLSVQIARPFIADLDLHPDLHVDEVSRSH